MLRIGSFCSGYGGLDMAVRAVLGGELAWWSDIDPGAIRIMTHHHPGVPNIGDITVCDWSAVEPVDVITAGYPCQPFSHAGKRKGTDDARHLWPYIREAIRVLRPRLVVLENVAGHRSLGFDRVLGDLAEDRMDVCWHSLRASDIGAPHRRERLFIAAYPAGQPWEFGDGDGEVAADARSQYRDERGRRAWDRRTGSAESRLLPTPVANEGEKAGQNIRHSAGQQYLTHVVHSLLPTPRASDGEKGGPGQRGSSGDLMLPSAVLLPTPTATPYGNNQSDSDGAAVRPSLDSLAPLLPTPVCEPDTGNGHARNLGAEVLLPTPSVADSQGGHRTRSGTRSDELLLPGHAVELGTSLLPTTTRDAAGSGGNPHTTGAHGTTLTDATVRQPDRWGKYGHAIHRWEVLTRPAPSPVQPSSKGTPQLAPVFSEWMMGLPLGWVTDPAIWEGMLTEKGKPATDAAIRNAQLHALGNGVVPQQAIAALRWLLSLISQAVAA